MPTAARHGNASGLGKVVGLFGEPMKTDGELLTRFITDRDEEAFTALVHRHGPLVLGICRRVINDSHLAEDAFQAVFLILAQKAHQILPKEMLRSWLFGVATRTALRAQRTATRRRKRETVVAAVPDRPQTPASPVETDLLRMLHVEIGRLPDHLRAAVVLCELDGMSRKDAAKRLGVPEGTLSSRLAKARKILANRFRGVAALPVLHVSGEVAVPATLSEAAIKNVSVNLGLSTGIIPSTVQSLSREVVRGMMRIHLKVGMAFFLVVVAGLIGAFAEEPVKEQPPKVAATLPVAPPPGTLPVAPSPRKVIPPKERALAAYEDWRKNLKSGAGEGEYEFTNSKGEPLKYALKVYHVGEKFHVELDYLSGSDAPLPPSKKIVMIYDGKLLACRDVNIRNGGEEARIWTNRDAIIAHPYRFAFNPTNLLGMVCNLPVYLNNNPDTEFASNQEGVSASREWEVKPQGKCTISMKFPENAGYNLTSREFHRVDTGFRIVNSVEWDRSGDTWFVRKIDNSEYYPDPEKISDKNLRYPYKGLMYKRLTYKSYEANAKIDPSVFQLAALDLVKGARVIYPDAESSSTFQYRNDPPLVQVQAEESILDSLKRMKLDIVSPNTVLPPKNDPPPKKDKKE